MLLKNSLMFEQLNDLGLSVEETLPAIDMVEIVYSEFDKDTYIEPDDSQLIVLYDPRSTQYMYIRRISKLPTASSSPGYRMLSDRTFYIIEMLSAKLLRQQTKYFMRSKSILSFLQKKNVPRGTLEVA